MRAHVELRALAHSWWQESYAIFNMTLKMSSLNTLACEKYAMAKQVLSILDRAEASLYRVTDVDHYGEIGHVVALFTQREHDVTFETLSGEQFETCSFLLCPIE